MFLAQVFVVKHFFVTLVIVVLTSNVGLVQDRWRSLPRRILHLEKSFLSFGMAMLSNMRIDCRRVTKRLSAEIMLGGNDKGHVTRRLRFGGKDSLDSHVH